MARIQGEKTAFPGVFTLGERRYFIRFRVPVSKTGRHRYCERIVEAQNARLANKIRDSLYEEELAKESTVAEDRPRVSDFAESWLSGKFNELKKGTLKRYASTIDLHVIPTLGDYYVDQLRHDDILKWRNAQDAEPATVNSRLRVLKGMLADATVRLDLPRDPAVHVGAVRDAKAEEANASLSDEDDEEQDNSLTREQLKLLLEATEKHQPKWYPLVAVLALTGMRIGEATALRWEDLVEPTDLRPGAIRIRRAQSAGAVDTPKTKAGRRRPDLPIELWRILRAHRAELGLWTFRIDQRDARKAKMTPREIQLRNEHFVEQGWIFPSGDKNRPMHPAVLRKPLMKVLAVIEKETSTELRIAVHGLRRTFINLLRQDKVEAIVARSIVGHTDARLTEMYSTVRRDEKRDAVRGIVTVLRPAPRTTVGGTVGGAGVASNG